MPFPSPTFLQQLISLSKTVADEFLHLYGQVEGYLRRDHKDDGSHAAVLADSVTLREGGTFSLADGTTWSLEQGVPTFSDDIAVDGTVTSDGAINTGALTVTGVGAYAVSGPGTNLSLDHDELTLRVASAGGSLGGVIFDATAGAGRLIQIVNTTSSAFTITHDSGGTFSSVQILCPQGADWVVEPGSSVWLWYDGASSRWRLISAAHAGPTWADYSTSLTWSSVGDPQPALNNATVVARYVVHNTTCHFLVRITMSAMTTFGTGGWLFSLPVDSAHQFVGTAQAHIGGTRYMGTLVRRDSAQDVVVFWNQDDSIWTATNPASWGSGSVIILTGTYEVS